jgi:hypothetical protein
MDNNILFKETSGGVTQENIGGLPDLSVKFLTIETPSGERDAGETIRFSTSIQITGDVGTEMNFNVKWFVNGEIMGYSCHDAIAGNSIVDDGNSQFGFQPDMRGSTGLPLKSTVTTISENRMK